MEGNSLKDASFVSTGSFLNQPVYAISKDRGSFLAFRNGELWFQRHGKVMTLRPDGSIVPLVTTGLERQRTEKCFDLGVLPRDPILVGDLLPFCQRRGSQIYALSSARKWVPVLRAKDQSESQFTVITNGGAFTATTKDGYVEALDSHFGRLRRNTVLAPPRFVPIDFGQCISVIYFKGLDSPIPAKMTIDNWSYLAKDRCETEKSALLLRALNELPFVVLLDYLGGKGLDYNLSGPLLQPISGLPLCTSDPNEFDRLQIESKECLLGTYLFDSDGNFIARVPRRIDSSKPWAVSMPGGPLKHLALEARSRQNGQVHDLLEGYNRVHLAGGYSAVNLTEREGEIVSTNSKLLSLVDRYLDDRFGQETSISLFLGDSFGAFEAPFLLGDSDYQGIPSAILAAPGKALGIDTTHSPSDLKPAHGAAATLLRLIGGVIWSTYESVSLLAAFNFASFEGQIPRTERRSLKEAAASMNPNMQICFLWGQEDRVVPRKAFEDYWRTVRRPNSADFVVEMQGEGHALHTVEECLSRLRDTSR